MYYNERNMSKRKRPSASVTVVETQKSSVLKKVTPKSKKKTIRWVLIIVCVCVVAAIGWFGFNKYSNSKNETPEEQRSAILTDGGESEADVIKAVEAFGAEYGVAAPEVNNSDPRKWDKAMLDKACLVLLYANKTGDFTQVQGTLYFMELAQRTGLNIDDNSWGVDGADRERMKQRAYDLSQKQLHSGGGQSE